MTRPYSTTPPWSTRARSAAPGCRPEYFPVVLAAWDAFMRDGMVSRSIWQSTTGTAPFSVLFGPLRTTLGFNTRGNLWGSGFRANATAGRAIRLGAINGLGLKPHVFESVQVVVAGAPNAGVSSIVETFGFWDRPMAVVKVEERSSTRTGAADTRRRNLILKDRGSQ